ncbi:MAG: flippase [Nitrospirota bacterium]
MEIHKKYEIVNRVAKNSAFVFFARVTDIGIALVSTALIARYLGVTDFGSFAFVMAITIFLGPFTDFGFERITTREIAGNKKLANRYLGSAVIARIFLSIIIIIIIYFITMFFDWDKKIIQAIYISTFAQLFMSTGMLAIGTFRAFERMEFELLLNFIFNIIYIVLLIGVILFNFGFLFIFGARLFASLLYMIILMVVAIRRFVKPILNVDIKLLRYLFKEAMPLGIFALLLTASFKVDIFVLNYFKGPEEVSLFEAAHRIIMQLQILPTSIVISLFPYFSRLAVESNDSLKISFYRSFKFLLIISLPLPILIIFASDFIISVLYGNSFIGASLSLSILSWTVAFLFLISLQTFVLTAKGRQVLNTISAGVCFMINLLLDITLVPRYGYLGASCATLISYILLFAVSFYFVCRNVGIPPLGEILPKPFMSGAGMGIGCLFLYGRGGHALVTAEIVITLIVYVAMIYILKTFTPDELSIIKSIFLKQKFIEKRECNEVK